MKQGFSGLYDVGSALGIAGLGLFINIIRLGSKIDGLSRPYKTINCTSRDVTCNVSTTGRDTRDFRRSCENRNLFVHFLHFNPKNVIKFTKLLKINKLIFPRIDDRLELESAVETKI
ncbi:MAG TPA: hypothetical protein DCY88_10320 [Cyanobacteria bacterium UBA11372]|nr:hypothetical protein [Cyanobacteria bacterium UBA11372]